MNSVCQLCHNERPLQESHIVPAFFGAYLKTTSATGYLRGAVSPNLRVQDLSKEKLLCDECEQRFSVLEKAFAENAFPVVQGEDMRELEYGDWLLRFIVSLSWRVLLSKADFLAKECPQFTTAIQRTAENWRLFLLGKQSQPKSAHHLFIIGGFPTTMSGNFHEKILHYLLRGIDATPGFAKRTLFVYTKALRSLFFSPIVPASPGGWINTRVHAGGGRLVSPQALEMPGFGDFLNSRTDLCYREPLSERQQRKINEAVLRDPLKALQSESYRVQQATRRLIHKKNRPR